MQGLVVARRSRPAVKMSPICYAKMLKELQRQPSSRPALAEATGLSVMTVGSYLQALHKEEVIHIFAWDKDAMGRDAIPLWVLGMGIDAKRHTQTKAQKAAAYRKRKREKQEPARPVPLPEID